MRCAICKYDKKVMCICGCCWDCIETYGHNKAQQMMNDGINDVKGVDNDERKN